MKISITIANKIAKADNPPTIVCGNSDYTIAFNFDAEWNEYALKTARFAYVVCGRLKRYIDVVFSGNECSVPKLHNIDAVEVGVYAGDLHTTTPAYIPCEKSILCDGGVPDAPSEDVYNQIMELIAESGAGGGKQEVFLAEFSKTQYADIHAAVESGMVVVVRDVEQGNVAYYALCEQTESGYAFGCIYGETPNFIVTVAIDVADVWSKKYTHLATEEYVDEKVATLELVKIVTELPEVGEENKTYFVTKTDGEGNDIYDEYMWINSAWEYIGTKTIEVDLTDYVKNTDFPDPKNFKAGVVRVDNYYGFNVGQAGSAGVLLPLWATNAEIDAKSDRRFINPQNFDYALVKSLENNDQLLPVRGGAGKNSAQQALDAASWAPDSSQTEVLTNAAVKKDGSAILTGAFGDFSTAMGGKSQATGKRAFAEGTSTIALGNYSHSEGNKTFAKAVNSHAEGLLTNALGEVSHSEGTSTIASGDASHTEGALTVASGYASHAENDQNEASGNASHAGGVYSKAKHNMSFVHGTYLETGRQNQAVFGEYNAVDGNALFVVGNGTSTTDRRNAFQVNADGTAYVNGKKMGDVFFAEYGKTTQSEVRAAIDSGKLAVCYYNNSWYIVTYAPSAAPFINFTAVSTGDAGGNPNNSLPTIECLNLSGTTWKSGSATLATTDKISGLVASEVLAQVNNLKFISYIDYSKVSYYDDILAGIYAGKTIVLTKDIDSSYKDYYHLAQYTNGVDNDPPPEYLFTCIKTNADKQVVLKRIIVAMGEMGGTELEDIVITNVESQIEALEARIAALEARIAVLESK